MPSSASTDRWTENRPLGRAPAVDVRELWAYRELVGFFAARDLKARYKQAAFGIGWAVAQPVLGALAFTLVFREVARVPSEGLPYPLFALLGVAEWTYVTSSVTAATHSLVGNSALITKVYFPRLLAPVAGILPGLVGLGVGLVLVGAAMAWYGIAPGAALLALPLAVLWAALVALGAGLLLATLNVRYRDVGQVFGLLLQLWLFASPVAYPTGLVPDAWRAVYALNPMVGVLELSRWSVLGTSVAGRDLLLSLAATVLLLAAGLWYFQRGERHFADVI